MVQGLGYKVVQGFSGPARRPSLLWVFCSLRARFEQQCCPLGARGIDSILQALTAVLGKRVYELIVGV